VGPGVGFIKLTYFYLKARQNKLECLSLVIFFQQSLSVVFTKLITINYDNSQRLGALAKQG